MSALFADAAAQWSQIHDQWLADVEALYLEGEKATRGHLLNKRGREAGIDARTLFYGPEVRVNAYASPELLEFFAQHGRLVYRDYEAAVLAERVCYCHREEGAA